MLHTTSWGVFAAREQTNALYRDETMLGRARWTALIPILSGLILSGLFVDWWALVLIGFGGLLWWWLQESLIERSDSRWTLHRTEHFRQEINHSDAEARRLMAKYHGLKSRARRLDAANLLVCGLGCLVFVLAVAMHRNAGAFGMIVLWLWVVVQFAISATGRAVYVLTLDVMVKTRESAIFHLERGQDTRWSRKLAAFLLNTWSMTFTIVAVVLFLTR